MAESSAIDDPSNEKSFPQRKCYMIWTPIEQCLYPGFEHMESLQHSHSLRVHRMSKMMLYILCYLYLILFLLSSLLFWYPYQNDQRNNITVLPPSADLNIQILDHHQVLDVLTDYLRRESPLLKVVALIRDTNIEKSYTVDIIKKRFCKRRDNDFSSLYPNFVVLENLRAENSIVVIDYVKTFQELYRDRQITLLAVFKVELSDDASIRNTELNRIVNTVNNTFIKENINIKIIPYEPLRESVLEKSIIEMGKSIGQSYTQNEINIRKRNLIDDIVYKKDDL